MKKLIIISVFFVLLFTYHITYADQCVPPTPPVCYINVPNQGTTLSDGQMFYSNGGGIGPATKQVEVSCDGTQKEIDYETQQLSYNTCLQVNTIASKTASNQSAEDSWSNSQDEWLKKDEALIMVCPYPQQPASQASESLIDTVEFPAGLITMKKYADNTYATFLISYYVGTGSEKSFSMLQAGQNDDNLIYQAISANNLDEMSRLRKDQEQYITYADSVQYSIDKYYANKTNCPDPSTQTSDLLPQSNVPSTISSSIKTNSRPSTLSPVIGKTVIPTIAPTITQSSLQVVKNLSSSEPKISSIPQSIAVAKPSLLQKISWFFSKLKFW